MNEFMFYIERWEAKKREAEEFVINSTQNVKRHQKNCKVEKNAAIFCI